jgi:hypothetical protein
MCRLSIADLKQSNEIKVKSTDSVNSLLGKQEVKRVSGGCKTIAIIDYHMRQ